MPAVCPARALYLYLPRQDNLTRLGKHDLDRESVQPRSHSRRSAGRPLGSALETAEGGPGHGGLRSAISLVSAAAAVMSAVM